MSAVYGTATFASRGPLIAESAMIGARMPSPIGHALAGVAAAWTVDLIPGDRAWRTAPASASWYRRAGDGLTLRCAALGAAPDLDLVVRHASHRHAQPRRRRLRRPARRGAGGQRRRPDRARRADVRRARTARICCSTGSAPTTIRRSACRRCGRSATSGTSRASISSGRRRGIAASSRAADDEERRARSCRRWRSSGRSSSRCG